jgi:putative membrane protein
MLAGLSFGTDLKRYSSGVLPRIALLTTILMPLLYGAMYLWAFWNPFGAIDKMPVALVNADKGAVVDGKPVHAGDQVASSLLDSGQLLLSEVSEQDAAKGLADGRYYFTITIPSGFSQAVTSPSGGDPTQAKLRFEFNGANNYLGTIIGQNAAREVIKQVNAGISEKSVDTVLTGLTDAGTGLVAAADGAQQLNAGLVTADSGAHQLASGSATLADGMATASDGAAQLADGTSKLGTAILTATDPIVDVLERFDGIGVDPDEVGEAAQHLSGTVRSAADRIAALHFDQARAAGIIDQAVTTLSGSPDPVMREVGGFLAGAQRLLKAQGIDPATDDGLIRLRDGATRLENELADPGSKLRTFLTSAVDGTLREDVLKLRSGVEQLESGAQRLSTGMVALTDGSRELASGAQRLAEGTGELQAGSSELADKLRQGSTQVPSWTPQQRSAVAKTVSTPVTLDLVNHNPAPTFGTGFAPFFLPLALFIGALIIWMLLTPLQPRPIINGLGGFRVVLASYWPALFLAVCQVAVMYTVAHWGVGLKARYPLATVAFLILVVATFLGIIQAFNSVFGVAVGRVATLAFLMLQLISAGGIYPVETTAKPFQIIHPADPMTYAVNGLRQLINGGIDERLPIAIAVLGGVLALSLAASSWSARRNRQYTIERLHPPIEV